MYIKTINKRILFQIDSEDLPLVEGKDWFYVKGVKDWAGGIVRFNKGKYEYLAKVVMKQQGKIVHIDGDNKNCKKENLKIIPYKFIGAAKLRKEQLKETYKGVIWDKDRAKFRVFLTLNGVSYSLGYFPTKRQALNMKRKALDIFTQLAEYFKNA